MTRSPRSPELDYRIPLAIFLFGLGFTSVVSWFLYQASFDRDRLRFGTLVDAKAKAIEEGLRLDEAFVRGAAGLFSSGLHVTKRQFENFVNRQRLDAVHKGVEALAWLRCVPADEKEAFTAWARSEVDPEFTIWPEKEGPQIVVTYVMPDRPGQRTLLGYDPSGDPTRNEALTRAADTGRPTLSGPFPLIQPRDDAAKQMVGADLAGARIGFVLWIPVFKEGESPGDPAARRANLLGFTNAAFRASDFLHDIFTGQHAMLEITIHDGAGRGNLIPMATRGANESSYAPRFIEWREIEVAGRKWTLRFASRPDFEVISARPLFPLIFAFGALGSLFLFIQSWRQVTLARRKAEIAHELQQSRSRLLELNRNLESIVESRTRVAEGRAAQLRSLAEQLMNAEQRERSRIAQVLHDDLQQILVAAKLHLSPLTKSLGEPKIEIVMGLISQAIQTSRTLSTQLDPGIIKERGLVGALEWAARKAREQHGLNVTMDLDPRAEPDSDDVKMFLLRAVQEALLNVVKHAGTLQAELNLRLFDDNLIELSIADHGAGRPEASMDQLISAERFGLFSIKRRLELFGGRFEVQTAEGAGLRVRMLIPRSNATAASPVSESNRDESMARASAAS